jgi:hypothetical protein
LSTDALPDDTWRRFTSVMRPAQALPDQRPRHRNATWLLENARNGTAGARWRRAPSSRLARATRPDGHTSRSLKTGLPMCFVCQTSPFVVGLAPRRDGFRPLSSRCAGGRNGGPLAPLREPCPWSARGSL